MFLCPLVGKQNIKKPLGFSACTVGAVNRFSPRRPLINNFLARCKRRFSPGRRAHVPCPAAGTASISLFRGLPPPHPLASRAVAFAWRSYVLHGETERLAQENPLRESRSGLCFCGCAHVHLPFAWCVYAPSLGFSSLFCCVFTILSERLRLFKLYRRFCAAARGFFALRIL